MTLSSGYKHNDTTICNNIRSIPTIKKENQAYGSVTKPIEPEIQQTIVKPKEKSFFNRTCINLIALFFGVYFFINLNSNPENPVELLN
jgi:hypothetical protein